MDKTNSSQHRTNSLNLRNLKQSSSSSSNNNKDDCLENNDEDLINNINNDLSGKRNLKFKYLTTNMQNLLKSFNENIISPRKDSSSNIKNKHHHHNHHHNHNHHYHDEMSSTNSNNLFQVDNHLTQIKKPSSSASSSTAHQVVAPSLATTSRSQSSSNEKKFDLDYITKKLKQIQNSHAPSNPIPSSTNPILKSSIKTTSSNSSRSKTIPNRGGEIQRPISNMDHFYTNNTQRRSADSRKRVEHSNNERRINRSQSQLNYASLNRVGSSYDNRDIIYENDAFNEEDESSFFNPKKSHKKSIKKSKSSQVIQALNSSKSSIVSESLDSDGSFSSDQTHTPSRSRSSSPSVENLSKQYRNTKSTSLYRKKSNRKNELAFSENISDNKNKNGTSSLIRRSSTTNLDSPRSIIIRRDKSINLQTNHQTTNSKNQDLPIMKQTLLASIGTSSSSNSNNKDGSSTTSGVESLAKTTTSSTNSKSNSELNHTTKKGLLNKNQNVNETNNLENNYITKINELKNRLFVLEIELDNEKKKANMEKEHKYQLLNELKLRYETEKHAALKALEAKLQAEKLYEINKIKEMVNIEKREEIDMTHKSFDSEILSLKLKLRDKSEQCQLLEKMLKEEHNKNEKLYMKSMEMVRKYNNGAKYLNESNIDFVKEKLKITNTASIAIQTELINNKRDSLDINQVLRIDDENNKLNSNDLDMFKHKLYNIKLILEENETVKEASNLNSINFKNLLNEVELIAKKFQKILINKNNDISKLKNENSKLEIDLKSVKETKQKLESLYKIKCKSDLNKSAQIKKLEINYECELMKFRNEYNTDIVRYLENKLVLKDSILNENLNKLSKFLNMLTLNDHEHIIDSTILKSKLDKLKESLQNLINSSLFSNSNLDLNHNHYLDDKLNLDNIYKKVPLNLIVKNELSDFSNTIKKIDFNQNDITQYQIQNFSLDKDMKSNKTIQEEMLELDKQIIDMKILSNSLIECQSKDKNSKLNKSDYSMKDELLNGQIINNKQGSSLVSSSSNNSNSSVETTMSSHSFIELEDSSVQVQDIEFIKSARPNVHMIPKQNKNAANKIELVVIESNNQNDPIVTSRLNESSLNDDSSIDNNNKKLNNENTNLIACR